MSLPAALHSMLASPCAQTRTFERSLMSESSKAIFLSYASQDAEAAQRICDALRAAGLRDRGLERLRALVGLRRG